MIRKLFISLLQISAILFIVTNVYSQSSSHSGGFNRFNGLIDEVRIWNDVRTAGEISANYNQAVSGSEQGLAAYYRFNEGSETTVLDERLGVAQLISSVPTNTILWSATDAGVLELNYALDFDGTNGHIRAINDASLCFFPNVADETTKESLQQPFDLRSERGFVFFNTKTHPLLHQTLVQII